MTESITDSMWLTDEQERKLTLKERMARARLQKRTKREYPSKCPALKRTRSRSSWQRFVAHQKTLV